MGTRHPRDAVRHLAAGIRAFHDLGGRWGLTLALLFAALVLTGEDGRERAAVGLAGAAEQLREAAGIGMLPFVGVWFADGLAALRARLTPDDVAREWRSGQERSAADAVRAALGELASLSGT